MQISRIQCFLRHNFYFLLLNLSLSVCVCVHAHGGVGIPGQRVGRPAVVLTQGGGRAQDLDI